MRRAKGSWTVIGLDSITKIIIIIVMMIKAVITLMKGGNDNLKISVQMKQAELKSEFTSIFELVWQGEVDQ